MVRSSYHIRQIKIRKFLETLGENPAWAFITSCVQDGGAGLIPARS